MRGDPQNPDFILGYDIKESLPDCYADLGFKSIHQSVREIPLCPYDSSDCLHQFVLYEMHHLQKGTFIGTY